MNGKRKRNISYSEHLLTLAAGNNPAAMRVASILGWRKNSLPVTLDKEDAREYLIDVARRVKEAEADE